MLTTKYHLHTYTINEITCSFFKCTQLNFLIPGTFFSFLRLSLGGSDKGGCGLSDVLSRCFLRVNEESSVSDLMEVYVWLYIFCICFACGLFSLCLFNDGV
jgi:hypothetical protein